MSKPWSVNNFRDLRPHSVAFCDNEIRVHINDPDCRLILVHAPVKSGKREQVEYLAVCDHTESPDGRKHLFVSAFHRTADNSQRDELNKHNLEVFSINNKTSQTRCIEYINDVIRRGLQFVVHLDECDYGSDSKQLLSSVYKLIRDNPQCTTILYSATPEEVLFSKDFMDANPDYIEMLVDFESTSVVVKYVPPAGYCGSAKFIEEGLVINAHPFIEFKDGKSVLSKQGKQICNDLIEQMKIPGNKRNVILLRLPYSDKTDGSEGIASKAIYQFICNEYPELEGFEFMVDKKDGKHKTSNISYSTVEWASPSFWRRLTKDVPIIIVNDQTCSRSTELACHDRLFATHSYRNTLTYGIVSQAEERVVHYNTKYGGFQPIRVYGHLPTWQLSAGLITYQAYMVPPFSKKINDDGTYNIEGKVEDLTECTVGLTEYDANHMLMDLGCSCVPKLSARIAGTYSESFKYYSEFIPCENSTFETIARPLIMAKFTDKTCASFRNPFPSEDNIASRTDSTGKIKGNIRGYRVLDFDADVKDSQWGFSVLSLDDPDVIPCRITVCYLNGQLGVGFRMPIEKCTTNCLRNRNSQYTSAISSSTSSATSNATSNATSSATSSVTSNLTSNATSSATSSATSNKTSNATSSSTSNKTSSATSSVLKPNRPTKDIGSCFKRNTLLHHFKPKDNKDQYALYDVESNLICRCDINGNRLGETFKTINKWTEDNLKKLGKKTTKNDCYVNVRYKTDTGVWSRDCDDMSIGVVLTK